MTPTPSETIAAGEAALGIEFGSTRIKAVLIDASGTPIATGGFDWENQLVDGLWSYPEEQIWEGLRGAYASLCSDVKQRYDLEITHLGAMGISAMMHGYIALDEDGQLLAPFRTWRNTNTGPATEILSEALNFNMPHRWSGAHLYQAVLDGEDHLGSIRQITTLAGLVHQKLSGRSVLGIGDASGMFPIDPVAHDYDQKRLAKFDELLAQAQVPFSLRDVLPPVLVAGQDAGHLTEAGARLLDPSGTLQPGVLMCPPEGDAGTGMVATNAVAARTGNVSAGTSIFAMVVLERDLARVHPELDMVTTPDGLPVAMVHSNNGASEWDQWVGVFAELIESAGFTLPRPALYDLAYAKALEGAADGGGLVAYNFLSGEPIVGLDQGRPLFFRTPDSPVTLANFMRTQLMAIFGVLRLGMDILIEDEGVQLDRLLAHGGLFKTPVVAQKIMAGALRTPVEVSTTAGEGGPWGMALLALYTSQFAQEMTLPQFLDTKIFARMDSSVIEPDPADIEGFNSFLGRYRRGLPAEAAAGENS
ncbi:xylulokinase [Actinomyces minihominis]|uniref:xylulokinase n=1 Tax=Actinomyces minihominis TaxID=2002838 RepID=UPI000C07FFED